MPYKAYKAFPTSESDVFFDVIVGVKRPRDFALLIGVTVSVSGSSSSAESSHLRVFAKNLAKHDGMVWSPASGTGTVSATTVGSLSEKKGAIRLC